MTVIHHNLSKHNLRNASKLTSPPGDFRRAPPIARGRWGQVDLLRFTTVNDVFIFDSWCWRPQESRNHAETSCIEDGGKGSTTCTRWSRLSRSLPFSSKSFHQIFQANGRTPCGTRLQEPRLDENSPNTSRFYQKWVVMVVSIALS